MSSAEKILGIPLVGDFYRKNYFAWKTRYWNFVRRMGISPGPYTVHWIATYRCNSNCVYCEASSNEVEGKELYTDEIKDVLDQLGQLRTRQFFIAGGEPLVRQDLFEVIDHAHARGIKVFMITNSLLYERFREDIRRARIDTIWTSVDGLRSTHDRNRGVPGSHEVALDAIRFYSEINIPVRVVNTFVNPDNIAELPQLFTELREAGISRWRIALAIPVGRGTDSKWALTDRQKQELFSYVADLRKSFDAEVSCELGYLGSWDIRLRNKPFFCFAGLTQCSIMPFGEVLPCQTVYNTELSEGNVREMSIKEIWRNGFRRFREGYLEKRCTQCEHETICRGGCWTRIMLRDNCLMGPWA